MDGRDEAILAHLRRDARTPFTALAKALGTSEGTIRSRIKKLVASGTIKRFTIETAGAEVRGLVEVTVLPHQPTADVASELRSWPDVQAVWEVTGDKDILVVADCPTATSLNQLIDRIRDVPGADTTRSRLILKEH